MIIRIINKEIKRFLKKKTNGYNQDNDEKTKEISELSRSKFS